MKYGCTPQGVTRLGEWLYDKELAELDDEYEATDDHSDEHFDRMDRQTELR
ncbi:hypothetical protein BGLT_05215 [Caballeronia glathei]|nr:hypothetical protein BGLT_05215 [Caballeronia glathei]